MTAAVRLAALGVALGAPAVAAADAPIPAAEWTDGARLALARSCVGEAGWGAAESGECAALAYLYARRWRQARRRYPAMTFERLIVAYSAPLSDPTPSRRAIWVRAMPGSLRGSLGRFRGAWARTLAMVDKWAAGGVQRDPCPGSMHFGGDMDRPPPGWLIAECRPAKGRRIRNRFYRPRPAAR